ncbi:hypothetical protein [Nitratidesulfovibrio liaohensis]|uniref:hypothetical protein n=1 Tax=Nitratidesulfovibrio liaohensis TaxID=2604158 RepID=UPI0014238DE1|nr:hypothetical protein [Nitratidesulfovibrio liaohensis]NHZ48274.1 hypothetical protein [Nitratidesulfovibrio liaohensis]
MKITRILPAALAVLAVLAITAGSALAAGSTGGHDTHAAPPAASTPADKAPGDAQSAPMQGCGCCQMMKDGHGNMGNMDAKPGGAGHMMQDMDGKAQVRHS